MWRIIGHCYAVNTEGEKELKEEYFILVKTNRGLPWHRLVVVSNGNILAGDEDVIKSITEFKAAEKT